MRFSLCSFALCVPFLASAHFHHDGSKHNRLHMPRASDSDLDGDSSLEKALKILASGQAAMALANKAIVANPRPNRLEVLNSTELVKSQTPPPLLDYHSNSTAKLLEARAGKGSGGNGTEQDMRYTLPDELIEAARLVSENWSPPNEDDSYAAAVLDLKNNYKYQVNDTNMMPPMLQYGSGLMSRVEEPPSAFRYGANESALVESSRTVGGDERLTKRGPNDWWMATIQQRGSSPFAPSGYKVWRNVKDFGAKGDGVADDTAAINLAISSGGRCGGGNCTGSTIYPATVYFPPGMYKVSSPIIQYYNTEILGNPFELPKIVAAPSFVGLGVITSNVYTGETSQWYLNQNNFLRSIRNLIMDIRATPQWAQVCAIHWQVAQATSLENIHFYMTKPADDSSTTQQGIYMENGSGGFLSDLYFIGGKFGAYMGNQQFTASGLYFQDAETAMQLHWDWGWTMQNIVVTNCQIGITIIGGLGGPLSNGQGVGSLLVTDMQMRYGRVGISTSVISDNATALLLSNSGFYAVDTIIQDSTKQKVMLAGGSKTTNVDFWGFGRIVDSDGNTTFVNGASLGSSVRDSSLVVGPRKHFFTRRRPKYDQLGFSQILDARAWGARGDGKSDDTAVLNHLFATAANMSAVVYMPFGVYLIKDTVEIPVGSRIIGQAWPQIMVTGSKFADALKPRVAVRVGRPGQAGVVEIQTLMFTVKGATAGAVIMEWNVHEAGQGSAGLWDTHFRIGGAAGTELTEKDCPKLSGKVNSNCIAASLLLHMTPESSAYLENVWIWAADHDFDTANQTQIDVYAGRGMLVESKGPTWLWATSVEHCVLYQYQLSNAQNIVMGLIQTESPYYQSVPIAPAPFIPGAFPNDPEFYDCSIKSNSKSCGVSWAVRIVDSSAIHILSAGLYSFFSQYDQSCIKSGRHDCQDKIFYMEQSYDIWIYNLVTLGSIEMISPLNGAPTLGKPNRNGFASSVLAWLGGSKHIAGKRNFAGYRIHNEELPGLDVFPDTCRSALTAIVRCNNATRVWTYPEYHGVNSGLDVDSVCDSGCSQSIAGWLKAVDTYCAGLKWSDGIAPSVLGSFISYGINETCQIDKNSGKYCNDIISEFSGAQRIEDMKQSELCSECYVNRLKMMQASPYSIYSKMPFYQDALKAAVSRCALTGQPTATKDSPFPSAPTETPLCLSDVKHTTKHGDTCNSLALLYRVSSAAVFIGNPQIVECDDVVEGVSICLPLQCDIYKLAQNDTCSSVQLATGLEVADLRRLNPWIERDCSNLQTATQTLGNVLCVSVPGGDYKHNTTNGNSDPAYSEYAKEVVLPPSGAVLADGTTKKCGQWQKIKQGDDCAQILVRHHISLPLFIAANPSVSKDGCSSSLVPGLTYCTNPTEDFLFDPNSVYIPEYTRFGCYSNKTKSSNGAVLSLDKVTHGKGMSVLACMMYCFQQSLSVFGIASGDSCLCDAHLRMDSELLDAGKCNTKCNGNSTDIWCGGDGAVQVYSIEATLPVESLSLGCYLQDSSKRVLEGESFEKTDMSVQKCGSFCTAKGNAFFALSDGSRCTCGQAVVSSAKSTNITECNVDCTDGLGFLCGGKGRAEIFTTKSSSSVASRDIKEPTPLPVYEYFGCYSVEKPGLRGLTHSLRQSELGMTVHDCARYCLITQGQTMFSLEEGLLCRCGSKLEVGVERRPDTDCSVPCAGNNTETCGGLGLLSLFGPNRFRRRPLAYSHVGCFPRETGFATGGEAEESMDIKDLTIERCAKECAQKFEASEVIFSVYGGHHCSCALSPVNLDIESPTSKANCNVPCAGDDDAWCGGAAASDVYRAWS